MNQINIGQRIKKKREQHKLSLQYVADKLDVNRSSVMRWENGETSRIKLPMLERLAQILQTTPEYLMGYEDEEISDSTVRNVLPESACMIPVLDRLQIENGSLDWKYIIDYEIADTKYRHDCFFLRISENSIAPRLEEGDRVLISLQSTLQNGETGVFLLDETESLIRIYSCEKEPELHSFNPYYPTLRFNETEKERLKIIGKVVESRRSW